MRSGSEPDVQAGLQAILDSLAPNRYSCTSRKNSGGSVIGKPVDLEIRFREGSGEVVVAVEVANVNTTQLVGETCRLYYDTCPTKLLVLGDRNVPANGKEQCEVLLARLYGQNSIQHTPARVVWFDDDVAVTEALGDLLLLGLPGAVAGGAG
jgi:hypothetical protein